MLPTSKMRMARRRWSWLLSPLVLLLSVFVLVVSLLADGVGADDVSQALSG